MTGNHDRLLHRAAAAPLVCLALALASCSSSPTLGRPTSGTAGAPVAGNGGASSPGADTKLKEAGETLLSQIASYNQATTRCATQTSPVVCIEAADRTLGGQVHTYANLLAVGQGFTAAAATLTAARNTAQTLANSLEILGDAQPTQANYDQVLNTFNLPSALDQMQRAVTSVNAQL